MANEGQVTVNHEVAENSKPQREPSAKERTLERKARLEKELGLVNDVLAHLEANPSFERFLAAASEMYYF